LRLVAERAGIQTIVLDNEGEPASLREAVDVLPIAAGSSNSFWIADSPATRSLAANFGQPR
jgi:hypothetical protein